ncbi:hypothetical protein [Moraxella catarrhalis]|uniref:hypothetical protein n=1 Tax=Moraxella catarrhalis TaxID=480 RepID=UPI0016051348|nr:hypothetical protein [Moraxella catarrhalis]
MLSKIIAVLAFSVVPFAFVYGVDKEAQLNNDNNNKYAQAERELIAKEQYNVQ